MSSDSVCARARSGLPGARGNALTHSLSISSLGSADLVGPGAESLFASELANILICVALSSANTSNFNSGTIGPAAELVYA